MIIWALVVLCYLATTCYGNIFSKSSKDTTDARTHLIRNNIATKYISTKYEGHHLRARRLNVDHNGRLARHRVFDHSHAHARNHTLTKPGGLIVSLNTDNDKKLYFLRNGKLRLVPNIGTAEILVGALQENHENVSLSTMINITQEAFDSFILDPSPVPSLVFNPANANPDNDLARYTDKFRTLQDPSVISRIVWNGRHFHPAVLKFENDKSLDILMACRGWEGALRETPIFFWMKKYKELGQPYPNVSEPLMFLNDGLKPLYNTEQVRMIELPLDSPDFTYPSDKSLVAGLVSMSFVFPFKCDKHGIQEYCGIIESSNLIVYKNGSLEVTPPRGMIPIDKVGRGGQIQEKNWMPFLYNNVPHYVYKLWPLTIVTQNRSKDVPIDTTFQNLVTMDYISIDSRCTNVKSPWDYGKMSGGSNVLLLPNGNEYLGFFHSRFCAGADHNGWCATNYWFGAFTFSSTFPFKLTSVSKYPIIEPDWYDGMWYAKAVSYIIYPLGFYFKKNIEKHNSYEIILSGSKNEEWSFLLHIDLDDLLNSMEPVVC